MNNSQNIEPLQLSWLWLSIGVLMLTIVAVASLIPSPDVGVNDKFMHTLTYFVLSAWFSVLARQLRSLIFVFVGLVVYGILLELLQSLTGYRMLELADAAANSLGVLLGLLAFFTPARRWLLALDLRLVRLVN